MEDIYANPVGIVKDIYVITNTINNKKYVGQSIDADRRFIEHCKNYISEVSLINKAIKKYGKENFTMEIVEHSVENYNERESYWINFYNSMSPNGYNLTPGGESPPLLTNEDHPFSTISTNVVNAIKYDLYNTDMSLCDIAKKYDVSKKHVLRINNGVSRAKLGEHYPIRQVPNINGKLTEDDVDDIIEMLKYTYMFDGEIARMYNVRVHAISRINNGQSHHRDNEKYPIRNWKSSGVILFTYEDVTNIINELKYTDTSMNKIAKKYGVRVNSIMGINNGSAKKYRRDDVEYPIRKYN